jgi:phage terminase Nu1 subunit (DNA packaging protein)
MRVSYNQLTELTGKTYRTLKRLLDGLAPVSTGPTNANLWESKDALPLIYCPPGSDDVLDLNAEKARETKAKADFAEIKLAEKCGGLLCAEDLGRELETALVNFKTKLTGLPSKLSALADEPDERRRLFIDAKLIIDEALVDLARMFRRAGK